MRLHSRAGAGLLKKFLSPANSLRQISWPLKSLPLPPLARALFSRLPVRSVLPTTSEIPAIARQFEQSFLDLTAGETSSAAPWRGNFARPARAGHPRALVVSAPEPSGRSIFRQYRSLRARNGRGPFRDSMHSSARRTEDTGVPAHEHQQGRSRGCNHEPPCRRECHSHFQRSLSRATGLARLESRAELSASPDRAVRQFHPLDRLPPH